MNLYHGSPESALKILRPNARLKSGKPLLYLTNNRTYSLFYIRDREIDFVTCGVDAGGVVHYDEKFEDQLWVLYHGRPGYIYITDQEAEKSEVNGIYICQEQARVTDVEYIPDVYEEIENGNIIFVPFNSLSEEQKMINHRGLVHYLQNFPITPQKEAFFRQYFPEAWKFAAGK